MSDKKVEFIEPPSIKAGRLLVSKGFGLASSIGIASNSPNETSSLGVLHKDPDMKPRKYLFGLFEREPQRVFLGTIWFDSDGRGAHEQHWVFEIRGRKYVELCAQLAKDMASTFNVQIVLRLVQEQPVFETCSINIETF